MSEKKGYFKDGRWFEAPPEATPEGKPVQAEPSIDDLIDGASRSVRRAINDVAELGRQLFGTPEGREHIERKARKAGKDLERTINEAAEAARRSLEERK
ncbi:MAG: hypothetical protein KO206_01425 [Methanomicrobiaceae archaeon]|nr:hypothetical protein [Methanomicrobiaceae archaeon]MDD5418879.1 hypothetical protein [Methanomicrobiaceae archaeon]